MEKSKSKKVNQTLFIEKEQNTVDEIKIDLIKKKKQTKIVIDGIEIFFPYHPYECQLNYMTKVIQALNNKSIAALESPTGTGKTLCLLCSTLGWVNTKRKELIESSSDKKITPPVIYYSTRTHSQISNVIKELRKTIYQPKTCILSSRDNLCVNNLAKQTSGTSLNIKCKKLRIKKECRYFIKTESLYGVANNEILDIEEILANGTKYEFCPFYSQRNKLKMAEIVFLPYNYIFDERFRSALKIDLKSSNAVLIIDEAHNIVSSLEDAKTFELSYKIIEDSLNDIKILKTVIEKEEKKSDISYLDIKEEENILINIKNYMKKKFEPKSGNWPNIGQKLIPEEFFKIFFAGSREDSQKRIDESKNPILEGITPDNINIHIIKLKSIETNFVELSGKSTILTSYIEFLVLIEKLYTNYKESKGNPDLLKTCFISNYKIFVNDEVSTNRESYNQKNRVLSLFCFNPGFAFNELIGLRDNGIIITSGTLSPIEGLESELKCQFSIKLENKHVIDKNQVHFSILPFSPKVKNLTYSFDMTNRNNTSMQEDLGITILELCKVTPGGVLVFFTSFGYLQNSINLWEEKNILNQIEKYKETFKDMQDSNKNKILIESFKKNSLKKGYRGGILFSVLRGKCSEGIDFSDDLARLVIVVGIPYANLGDVKIQLKKEYLGESHNNSFRRITPSQWYTENATRAVNQALGRVIRHVDDYGVMILIDQRYLELSNKKVFSSWLREIAKKYGNCEKCDVYSDVSKFYNRMASFIREKKAKELAIKNTEKSESKEIIIQTVNLDKSQKNLVVVPPENNLKRVNVSKTNNNNKLISNKENLPYDRNIPNDEFVISDEILNEILFENDVNGSEKKSREKMKESSGRKECSKEKTPIKLIDKNPETSNTLSYKSENINDENNLESVISKYSSPNKKKILIEQFKNLLSKDDINQIIPNILNTTNINNGLKNDGKIECQICFEMSENNLSGECGHVYCGNCWTKLFEERKIAKCPACKKEIKKKRLRKVFI